MAGLEYGKSTLAAEIFFTLKKRGYNVELVTEYAKDLVYEKSNNISDSLLMLAVQHNRIYKLLEHNLDYAIIDSPIYLPLLYFNNFYDKSIFEELIKSINSKYDNFNVLLHRNSIYEYNPVGRNEKTIEEALKKDKILLDDYIDIIDYFYLVGKNNPTELIDFISDLEN